MRQNCFTSFPFCILWKKQQYLCSLPPKELMWRPPAWFLHSLVVQTLSSLSWFVSEPQKRQNRVQLIMRGGLEERPCCKNSFPSGYQATPFYSGLWLVSINWVRISGALVTSEMLTLYITEPSLLAFRLPDILSLHKKTEFTHLVEKMASPGKQ